MSQVININCDMGESYGRWQLGNDQELMKYVPTINIACGFHAGDPSTMRRTVELAAALRVEVGVHPGLPDLLGFGRRQMIVMPDELRDYITYQIGALWAFAKSCGIRLSHVKPHGVLYHMCGTREEYAVALLEAVGAIDSSLIVINGGPAISAVAAGSSVTVVPEGYVDLAYQPSGFPVIERVKQAWDPEEVAYRALRVVREGKLQATDNSVIEVKVPTICIHGDAPNAVEVARVVRERLSVEGIEVVSLREAVSTWSTV